MSNQHTPGQGGKHLPAGAVLAKRYEIQSVLGSGGMATVYRATDTLLTRDVAVKVMAPWLSDDETYGRRFSEEARAAAGLNHANIVTIYDTVEEAGQRYIVMEPVDGTPLSELIPLAEERAVDIAQQLAEALDYAHSKGIIHCDIKPQNVLVEDNGRPRLLDFGIARAATQTWAMATTVLGTAAYMAPEVVEGRRPDARSDVYSLATLLYEMLAGRLPFEAESAAAQTAQRLVADAKPLADNVKVLPAVEEAVMAGLERDPDKRPQSAAEFARRLEAGPGDHVAADALLTVPIAVPFEPSPKPERPATPPAMPPSEPDPTPEGAAAEPPGAADGPSPRGGDWRRRVAVPLAGLVVLGSFAGAFFAADALFADSGDEVDYEAYFNQVEATFSTFESEHEQEASQFGGQQGQDSEANKQLYVDFLRAYVQTRTEFIGSLEAIEPPEDVEDQHQRYLEAATAVIFALDQFANQVDETDPDLVGTLDISTFEQAEENQIRACNDLQAAASEKGVAIDLQCSDVEGAVRAPALSGDQPPAAEEPAPQPVGAGRQEDGDDNDEGDDDEPGRGEGRGNDRGQKDKGKDGD